MYLYQIYLEIIGEYLQSQLLIVASAMLDYFFRVFWHLFGSYSFLHVANSGQDF